MNLRKKCFLLASVMLCQLSAWATIEGSLDPESVVEQWSNASKSPKIIDINFSDTSWPDTWIAETGRDCPEWDNNTKYPNGGYVNAVLSTPVNGDGAGLSYPILFHNCTFATKASYGGHAGATAAFSRQYYLGEKCSGNSATTYNNWTVKGHTHYLEDNIQYGDNGKPIYGEAGFVQMCRNAATRAGADNKESLHGWVEIDHVPYIERIQWSWSSTSWGRGIKCDIKIGNGEWKPLVWMGSEKQKQGWTAFSDQGYFMENIIDAHDVSIRWRVWDGEDPDNVVQNSVFTSQTIDPLAERQAPRLHKLQIFGDKVTAEQAEYAKNNPVGNVGTLTDLSQFGFSGSDTKPAPDEDAPIVLLYVNPDGSGDYTTIQAAIDNVPDGSRGIIYIAPGIYDENIYAGRKDNAGKFISLIGADAATTILTSDTNRGGSSTNTYLDCAALNVFTPCFYAENLTIRNTSGNVGQAEALYTAGDAHVFKNCVLSGYQDTYKANVGARGYFTNCTIAGCTDFIYDGGLEWFEDCEILCVKGRGYITAPSSSSTPMTKVLYPSLSADNFYPGLFFRNCKVTAEDGVEAGSYTLGRPWDELSGAMFIKCTLGNHINATGWTDWNGRGSKSSLYEYRNIGPDGKLVNTSGRASFSRQASDAEVEEYMNPEFLFAKASNTAFDYEKILRGAASPTNFAFTTTGITWESDDMAAGYIVYRNGEVAGLTATPSWTIQAGDNASYSVSAISRHGVTSPIVNAAEATQLAAFPTAEGFGKYATGGRGGKVVKVTSLADDGSAGTLRWAFDQHKGEPITIIFEVSGDIALGSELRVNRANWTLAGQSAPGEGIVITRNKVNFGGSQNFIVRNVRFRIGHKDINGNTLMDNACGAENCSNFIFDHCSFGWSVEENMNTADCHFLTVQYSMVHEGLYNGGHTKGARGYGCQWGGSPATYHHNLLAHNNSRTCRFNGARGEDNVVFIEYVNNVNYNYGKRGACYGGENTADIASYNGLNSAHECNFMNNYYKPGAYSDKNSVEFVSSSYAREGAKSWAPAKWYVNGNIAEGFDAVNADNWKGMVAEVYTLDQIRADKRITPATPYYKYTLAGAVGTYVPERYMLENFETAKEAFNTVVAKAGTINRDKVERRVAEDTRDGKTTYTGSIGNTKGVIDRETDAEGFFAYSSDYTVPTDTDGDGMPDEWEQKNNLNPSVADNNLVNSEGYTALEAYLNSLMGETTANDFHESGIADIIVSTGATYDSASHTLTVGEEAVGAILTVYGTDGRLVASQRLASRTTSLAHLPAGILLVKIEARNLTPTVLKINR